MKSIGKKIFYTIVIMTIISLLFLGTFASTLSYKSTMEMAEMNLSETAGLSAQRVAWEIQAYSNIASELGMIKRMSDESVPVEDKLEILNNHTEKYGLQRCNLVDINGDGVDGNNYTDRVYYQNAMKGLPYVSSPLISKVTGKITVIVAAPLWKDGVAGGESVGCVYIVPDEEFLNDIVRDIKASENSVAYIIDKSGSTIANIDSDVVLKGENISETAKDPAAAERGYGDIAAIHKSMLSGNAGYDSYTLDGEKRFMGYSPIEGTDGWSLAIYAPANDFLESTIRGIYFTVIVVVVSVVIAAIISARLGMGVGRSVRLCTERIEELAAGDLQSGIPEIHRQDEAGRLAMATQTVVESLNNMIGDIGRVLEAMADGDLGVNTDTGAEYYVGDFEKLLGYIKNINSKLGETIAQINTSADQVTSGADQVSSGAQALSQGATEQASEIEQLASRIAVITTEVEENYGSCESANKLAEETIGYMNTAISEMSRLNGAMTSINETSEHIGNIIKTIEDIAFQTNILALNAAVEASRAGEAGKGFAVVADEVRNLASKSAEAAKTTTTLIQQSLEAVHNGSRIAGSTSEALAGVEKRALGVEEVVKEIASASEKQAGMIEQIKTSIEQISSVVQTNSATAEQSAAASEELSGQASILRELIGVFRV
ncbi:MAG: methyl-accepting chemotaxis protein [Oscillospiraceae bacterium]